MPIIPATSYTGQISSAQEWLHYAPIAIWGLDIQGNLCMFSNLFQEFFVQALGKQPIHNKPFIPQLPQALQSRWAALIEQAMQGNSAADEHTYLIDNQAFIALIKVSAVYSATGLFQGISGTITDITTNKISAQKLAETLAFHNAMIHSAGQAIICTDPGGTITFFNNTAEQLLGYQPNELIGRHNPGIFHDPDEVKSRAAQLSEEYNRPVEPGFEVFILKALEGQPEEREWTYIHKNGRHIPIRLTVSAIRTNFGQLIGFIGIASDISQQKLSEQVIYQSEARYRDLFENASDLIQSIDMQGRFQFVNRQWKKVIGFNDYEIRMLNVFDIMDPDHVEPCKKKFALLMQGHNLDNAEMVLITKFGEKIILSGNISPIIENGIVVGTRGIFRNITAQKNELMELERRDELLQGTAKALQALLMANSLNQALQEALSILGNAAHVDTVYVFDSLLHPDTGQPALRPRAAWHRDKPKQEKDLESNFHTDSIATYADYGLERWYQILSSGNILTGLNTDFPEQEQLLLDAGGVQSMLAVPIMVYSEFWGFIGFDDCHQRRIWKESEISILQSVAGSIAGAIERDQTQAQLKQFNEDLMIAKTSVEQQAYELSNKNEELVLAREQAEAASKAKSAFLSSMSHELRTPLNAILGFAQILRKDSALGEQHRNFVDMMFRSGSHLLEMINDVLDISKIEAGHLELLPGEFDLYELLSDIETMFALRCREKSLQLVILKPDEQCRYIVADSKRLRQILINLTGNAVKFTSTGGITIAVHASPLAENSQMASVEFAVHDTGRGIPQDQLQKIFEPFRQVSGMYSEGTGLGLAICSRLVRMMGSSLQVESRPEAGSRFWFTLHAPINKRSTATNEKKTRLITVRQKPGERPWRILIVDDIANNRLVARGLLEPIGIECQEAIDGEDALEQIWSFRPDLVLMDILMPVMNGEQATRSLRSLPEYQSLPIIAVTASGFDGKREELLAAGFSEYLRKPFLEEELISIIAQFLPLELIYEQPISFALTNEKSGNILSPIETVIAGIHLLNQDIRQQLITAIEIQDLDDIERICHALPADNKQNIDALLQAISLPDYKFLADLAEKMNS
jgi:PAS domain S-box-containing protein